MCRCYGETVDHSLLHCVGRLIVYGVLSLELFGIPWVLTRSVEDFLFGWWNWLGKHSSNIWNLVSLCLLWCIWKEHNWRTFEDLDRSDDHLPASFIGSFFDWSRTWGLTSSLSLPLFLSSLFLCN